MVTAPVPRMWTITGSILSSLSLHLAGCAPRMLPPGDASSRALVAPAPCPPSAPRPRSAAPPAAAAAPTPADVSPGLYVDGAGNVGIGKMPSTALDVSGSVKVAGSADISGSVSVTGSINNMEATAAYGAHFNTKRDGVTSRTTTMVPATNSICFLTHTYWTSGTAACTVGVKGGSWFVEGQAFSAGEVDCWARCLKDLPLKMQPPETLAAPPPRGAGAAPEAHSLRKDEP